MPQQVEPPVVPQGKTPADAPAVEPVVIMAVHTILESIMAVDLEEILNRGDGVSRTNDTTKASRKPVKTTSQQAKKECATKTKVGVHVKMQQKRLYPICSCDEQQNALPKDDPDCAFYYGIMAGGTSQKGYMVQFEILPEACDTIQKVRHISLFGLDEGDDKPLIGPELQALLDAKVSSKREKGKLPETKDEDEFVKQDNEILKTTKLLKVRDGVDEGPIEWTILGNGEYFRVMQSIQKSRKICNPI
jgi:hypothetical protein